MSDIFDKSVLINLSIGLPGNNRRVNSANIEVEADKDWIGVSKHLIDPASYKPICEVIGDLKRYLERKCIIPRPTESGRPALRKFLKSGIYMLPVDSIAEVYAEFPKYVKRFNQRRDELVNPYPQKQEEAKQALNGEFNENDYLSTNEFKASFYMELSYITVGTPDALKKVSASIFKKEFEKTKAQLDDVYSEVRQVLRAGFQGLVKWMVNILEDRGDGKKKQFRQSSVQRFIDFLGDFQAKDLTNDTQLKKLIDDARGLLAGQDIASLQIAVKSEDFRDRLRDDFLKIQNQLDPLVDNAPTRLISMED